MTDTALSLTFSPFLPIWLLIALAVIMVLIVGFSFWRRAKGTIFRAMMLAVGLLALFNPVAIQEEREPIRDTVLMVTDRSPSQAIDERPGQVDEAVAGLRERLKALPDTDLAEATVSGEGKGGTLLFQTLGTSLAEIGRPNVAGVVIVTDGQVHDLPDEIDRLGIQAPVHVPAQRPARRIRPAAGGRRGAELRRGRRPAGDRFPRRGARSPSQHRRHRPACRSPCARMVGS